MNEAVTGIPVQDPPKVSPWIEPHLLSWVRTISPTKPAFCFVNILDAHEPYIGIPGRITSLRDWFRLFTVPQYGGSKALKGSLLAKRQWNCLRELYDHSLDIVDTRLSRDFRDIQYQSQLGEHAGHSHKRSRTIVRGRRRGTSRIRNRREHS